MPIYFIFSKRVEDDNKNSFFHPFKPANVSTAKITIVFSFFVAVLWGYLFLNVVVLTTLPLILKLSLAIFSTLACSLLGMLFKSDISHHEKFTN